MRYTKYALTQSINLKAQLVEVPQQSDEGEAACIFETKEAPEATRLATRKRSEKWSRAVEIVECGI